jgi:hypothetical protein
MQTHAVAQHRDEELLGWFNEAFVTMKKTNSPIYRPSQAWIDRIKTDLKESRQTLVLGEKDVAPTMANQFRDVSGLQLLLMQGIHLLSPAFLLADARSVR